MFRWLQELSTYQFDVVHTPRKDMPADPLSISGHLRDLASGEAGMYILKFQHQKQLVLNG